MLTWMERHPFPFACTTNAPELLDPATARRFLFKVRFLPMDEWQIAAAFFRAFGIEAPRSMLKLDLLTPGDFAVVARKAEVLGERDPARRLRWTSRSGFRLSSVLRFGMRSKSSIFGIRSCVDCRSACSTS